MADENGNQIDNQEAQVNPGVPGEEIKVNENPNPGEAQKADDATSDEEVNLVVDGFEFLSEEDVKKAKLDKHKIEVLRQKVHSTKISDIEAVYEKAITNKIFATPIGWHYLARLRDKLISAGVNEEDLIPIPVNTKFTKVDLKDEYHPRQYILPPPQKKKRDVKATMIILIAMNLILVAMVVSMFLIAYYSETDNIINYKQNVTNRYAEWEDSLKEREKAVRIKEKELDIQDDTEYDSELDTQ